MLKAQRDGDTGRGFVSTGKPSASSSHGDPTKTQSWDTPSYSSALHHCQQPTLSPHSESHVLASLSQPGPPTALPGPLVWWAMGWTGKPPTFPAPHTHHPCGLQAGGCAISLGHTYLPLTYHWPIVCPGWLWFPRLTRGCGSYKAPTESSTWVRAAAHMPTPFFLWLRQHFQGAVLSFLAE